MEEVAVEILSRLALLNCIWLLVGKSCKAIGVASSSESKGNSLCKCCCGEITIL